MMLKLPRFCSASGMFARFGTDGFQAIVRKKVASLVRRIRGSSNSILKVVAEDPGAPVLRHFMTLHCPHEMPRSFQILSIGNRSEDTVEQTEEVNPVWVEYRHVLMEIGGGDYSLRLAINTRYNKITPKFI